MKASSGAALGLGAGLFGATVGAANRAFERAAQAMNAQIEQDLFVLGRDGHLPPAQPVLPLTQRKRSLPLRVLSSLALGMAVVAMPTSMFMLVFGLADPEWPLAMDILGAVMGAFIAAVLTGWLPGAVIFVVRQLRENNRCICWNLNERYADYWSERQWVEQALRSGNLTAFEAAQRLQSHHLDHLVDV